MKLNDFYKGWGFARAILLILAAIILMVMALKAHCFNLEAEYTGPGSSAERMDQDIRERESREAAERVNEGSKDPKDLERAALDARDRSA